MPAVKEWDAFISHASEDKDLVLRLAVALQHAGLKIWLDRQELRLGDSLSEKIDEGLAASRFGIVVLSPSFFSKRWPRRELNGLMAREDSGQKVILPIWHEVDKETVARSSPILADRLASETARGIASVVADIVQVVTERGSGSPSSEAPTLARRLVELLNSEPEPHSIRDFLSAHSEIVHRALGRYTTGEPLRCAVQIERFSLDLCAMTREGTTGRRRKKTGYTDRVG